jgi:hypothetical protein
MTKDQFLAGEKFLLNDEAYRYKDNGMFGKLVDDFKTDLSVSRVTDTGFEVFHGLFGFKNFEFGDCKL